MKKIFKIEVDCAVCANKIEDAVNKVEGVTSCKVNYMTQKMTLEANDDQFSDVLKKAVKTAKKVEPDFDIEL